MAFVVFKLGHNSNQVIVGCKFKFSAQKISRFNFLERRKIYS